MKEQKQGSEQGIQIKMDPFGCQRQTDSETNRADRQRKDCGQMEANRKQMVSEWSGDRELEGSHNLRMIKINAMHVSMYRKALDSDDRPVCEEFQLQ